MARTYLISAMVCFLAFFLVEGQNVTQKPVIINDENDVAERFLPLQTNLGVPSPILRILVSGDTAQLEHSSDTNALEAFVECPLMKYIFRVVSYVKCIPTVIRYLACLPKIVGLIVDDLQVPTWILEWVQTSLLVIIENITSEKEYLIAYAKYVFNIIIEIAKPVIRVIQTLWNVVIKEKTKLIKVMIVEVQRILQIIVKVTPKWIEECRKKVQTIIQEGLKFITIITEEFNYGGKIVIQNTLNWLIIIIEKIHFSWEIIIQEIPKWIAEIRKIWVFIIDRNLKLINTIEAAVRITWSVIVEFIPHWIKIFHNTVQVIIQIFNKDLQIIIQGIPRWIEKNLKFSVVIIQDIRVLFHMIVRELRKIWLIFIQIIPNAFTVIIKIWSFIRQWIKIIENNVVIVFESYTEFAPRIWSWLVKLVFLNIKDIFGPIFKILGVFKFYVVKIYQVYQKEGIIPVCFDVITKIIEFSKKLVNIYSKTCSKVSAIIAAGKVIADLSSDKSELLLLPLTITKSVSFAIVKVFGIGMEISNEHAISEVDDSSVTTENPIFDNVFKLFRDANDENFSFSGRRSLTHDNDIKFATDLAYNGSTTVNYRTNEEDS